MLKGDKDKAVELLTHFRKKGVSLWEDNGKLRYKAPRGVLKDDDLQALKYYKKDILNLLQAEAKFSTITPDPESRFEPFPLTDVQSAYLLGRHEAFGYGGVGCHIYMELNYPELDPERAEAVWNQLISRHDMLRVVIDRNGYQRVLKDVPHLKIDYTDASSWEKQEIEANLNQIREELGHRVYEPEHWPLFDIAITKTPDNTILHFSMDFLMADWASIMLLLSEFETLYAEPAKRLSDLSLTFRDYVLAERRLRESPAYFRDKEYWLSRISDLPPAPDLPLTQKQDKFGTARFRRRFLKLNKFAWEKLKQQAQKRGLTPTIAVIAAYAAVIERWSREKRFCLNLTVLNRLPLHPQINNIVGDFTSISLLSVDWGAGSSFYECAKALNRQLFEDLEHRLFSGVEVLREIRRRGHEDALMPIVFTSGIGLWTHQLKGKVGYGISQTPQVFIDCQAMDSHDILYVNWDVREGVFPDGMIDDMFSVFEKLLHSLAETDETWDAGEAVTLPVSQQIKRRQVNDTRAPIPDQLLHYQILVQTEATPDRPAVFDGEGEITYAELVQKAAAVAKRLEELGCKTQDRVAIVMDKSAYQVVAVLGTLMAGAIYVPIDTMQPELRRSFMIEQADAHFVLQCSSTSVLWPESTKQKIEIIEVDKLEPFSGNIPVSNIDPDLPAYIIYTSGSTGQPKGVVLSHRSVVNTIADINRRFNINQNDRVLGLSRLSFDLSVYDIFGPLSVGGALIYPSSNRLTDPSHWAELIVEKKVTIWNSVPAMMQMLVEYASGRGITIPESLRLVLLSGDWIPLDLPEKIKALAKNAKVISLGGATEASIWSILYPVEEVKPGWKSIPYGKPMTNQRFYVLNESMEDCPDWVPGQLYIGGVGLAKGYWKDEKKTQNSFIIHPKTGERLYRTGDLGRYLPDGNIEFLGREDNQVKIMGYRIELGEIEAALKEHSDVNSLAVVATGDKTDKKLVAFVVSNEGKKLDKTKLEEFLRRKLPEYMIPSSFVFLDKMPLTPNGKI
ncbi:amino acid adenylation domain-containing protein, partial [Candidatus Aerophobetes bacterium]|nr:amino acid adenylation domain-containing protein [Candidatus Aerophobetes bacterium]